MAVASDQYTTAAVFAGTFALVYLVFNRVSGQRALGHKSLPPSIGCLPIVGSIPYLPGLTDMHTFFAEKARELGGVISFSFGPRYAVVLNSQASIREAFVKRSTDFADRPKLPTNDANPRQKGINIHYYNATFKKYHQLSLAILKKFGFGNKMMEARISAEVQNLMERIKELNGHAFEPNDKVFSAVINVISSLVFGRGLDNDPHLKQICFDVASAARNAGGQQRRSLASKLFSVINFLLNRRNVIKEILRVQNVFFHQVEKEISENLRSPANDNFIRSFIEQEGEQFDKEQLMHTVRDLIVAGTETSSTTVLWALVLLADHPDVQRRLQEEIDSVVPKDRLPSLDDKQKLPYVEAAILEIMRFKTLVPMGVPHATLCDAEVGGYFIPKETVIMPNLYAAHMDPNVWDKPHEFRPERFLDDGGNVINKEMMIAFSLGKRSCLGELLARQEVYLFITGFVQQFHIRPPEGVERIDPKEHVTRPRFIVTPELFQVRCQLRDLTET